MAKKVVEEIILKVSVNDKDAKTSLRALSTNSQKAKKNVTALKKETKSLGREAKNTAGKVDLMGKALKFGAGLIAIDKLIDLSQEAINVSRSFERAGLAMETAFGPATASQIAFVNAEAERLGVNALSAQEGYAKLANSAKIAGISTEDTQEIFTATSEAATALGLSADDVNGVLRAFAQSAAKGKIQAEELMQIAERGIPVQAMMADAIGVSNEELQDMAQKGELLANENLPKLAKAIKSAFHEGALKNANSELAESQRNTNLWNSLMERSGSTIKSIWTPSLRGARRA
jgi:tape measure domain-containing protein